ncbi:MAG: aldehyde ferredoxin oxidoreductase family protein [Chloroflexota bacterium]
MIGGAAIPVGYWGRIARVDLTSTSITEDVLDDLTVRLCSGGSLLATWLLLRDTTAGLDAFDERAMLVLASSVVGGQAGPGLARFAVVGKSPLSGGIGEGRAEGPFGAALKQSGFDAIVVTGRAAEPVAIVVADRRIEIVPASKAWGLDTSETVDWARDRVGGPCNVAAIGSAGEQLVRFASVVSDRSFAAARTGLGAVMGSKRLKAVVIAGGRRPEVADPDALAAIAARYAAAVPANPVTAWQHQPPGFGTWVGAAPLGAFGVENFRTSRFDASGYDRSAFVDRLAWSDGGCPDCPTDCIKGFVSGADIAATERTAAGRGGGLHQEAVASLGPNLGLATADEALLLNEASLRLGLDPVSLGMTMSFAMECVEQGLLTAGDLGGVELRFGDAAAALEMTERIARRGSGAAWLADGAARAAAAVSRGAGQFALHVKGIEIPPFDPRAQAGLALGYATAPFGPRYDVAEHDADFDDERPSWPHSLELARTLGILDRSPATAQTAAKVRDHAVLAELWSAFDALLVCPFAAAPVRILSLHDIAALVAAVTGWETSSYEVMAWGARRLALMRMYNAREGLSSADDGLPDRFFDEPLDAGPIAGARLDREAFAEMKALLYAITGCDEAGVPTPATRLRHHFEWTLAAEAPGWPSIRPSA